jgi:hypothetical protein
MLELVQKGGITGKVFQVAKWTPQRWRIWPNPFMWEIKTNHVMINNVLNDRALTAAKLAPK